MVLRLAPRAFWALMFGFLAADLVRLVVGVDPAVDEFFSLWVTNGLMVAATGTCLARAAARGDERVAWGILGVALLSWTSGNVYWTIALRDLAEAPFPSFADYLWLAFLPICLLALTLMARGHVVRFQASLWLDGALGGLAIATLGAALVFEPVLRSTGGTAAAVATNLAYPLGDILLLAMVVAVIAMMGWRPGRAWALLAVALGGFAISDGIYLWQVAAGTYQDGTILDAGWVVAFVLMAAAAWQPSQRPRGIELQGWRLLVVPAVSTVIAGGILTFDHFQRVGTTAVLLAVATLLVAMVRSGLTFRENVRLADSHRLAVTDPLTGLPNRRLFHDRVAQEILRARRLGSAPAVLIMDLDRFKEVNDTLGHGSGDVLLQIVARRLRAALREGDTVARLGGDEFAVLLPDAGDAAAAREVADALGRAVALPIAVHDLSLDTEMSVGIAMFPEHGDEVDLLLQHADVAMYAAKAARTGCELYRVEDDQHSPGRLALVGEVRRAIAGEELVLHYQPKIDLVTDEVRGVEVLLRWQHPERGLLPPAEFIPLTEHTALIKPLTLYVLDRALGQCRHWEDDGLVLSVAVNLSVHHLLDAALPGEVSELLDRWQLAPDRLELEITEGTLMSHPDRALEVLGRLSELGVGLSIDDFGVGYSSLNYLKQLPIDTLKIDRSFVMNMSASPGDAMIVRSTIDLGRNLGLHVVAEGIETPAVLAELRELGCPAGQGYHISRPVPADELARWARSRPAPSAVPAPQPASVT